MPSNPAPSMQSCLPGDPIRAAYPKTCTSCKRQLRHPKDKKADWPGTVQEQADSKCKVCAKGRSVNGVPRTIANRGDSEQRLAAAFAAAEQIRLSRERRGVRPTGGYYQNRQMTG